MNLFFILKEDKKMKLLNKEYIQKVLKKRKLTEFEDEILQDLEEELKKIIDDKIKEKKNKLRIIKNDEKKEQIPAKDFLREEQIKKIPDWVKKNLDKSYIIGKSGKVIQTPDGKKYHLDNKLNDLSGGEWTYFLNSVINTRYSTTGKESYAHHIRKIHPSPKPPQLMKQIIEFFTKKNEWVLDYFMGVSGSLLGASLCGRKALGIELSQEYIEAYKKASQELNLNIQPTIQGDSLKILKNSKTIFDITNGEKFSLILIDPPYGDMMSRPKTGQAAKNKKNTEATPFTNLEEDLGNMSWNDFKEKFIESLNNASQYLKDKGHIVIFIKDLQPKGKDLNLLHCDIIKSINDNILNIYYLGMKIWADHSVNLYPYGYPYSFVSNQIHQYILIFQKK
jgi:DNA modification methylase